MQKVVGSNPISRLCSTGPSSPVRLRQRALPQDLVRFVRLPATGAIDEVGPLLATNW